MQKIILRFIAALVVVSLATQIADAAPRGERKVVRAPARSAHQFRQAHDFAPKIATPPVAAPRIIGSKSCDMFWCYDN